MACPPAADPIVGRVTQHAPIMPCGDAMVVGIEEAAKCMASKALSAAIAPRAPPGTRRGCCGFVTNAAVFRIGSTTFPGCRSRRGLRKGGVRSSRSGGARPALCHERKRRRPKLLPLPRWRAADGGDVSSCQLPGRRRGCEVADRDPGTPRVGRGKLGPSADDRPARRI